MRTIKNIIAGGLITLIGITSSPIAIADSAKIEALKAQVVQLQEQIKTEEALESVETKQQASQQEQTQSQDNRLFTGRTRTEYTSQGENYNLVQTIGIGRGDTSDPSLHQFGENFRAYISQGKQGDAKTSGLELGVTSPLTRFTGLKDNLIIYGVQNSSHSPTTDSNTSGLGIDYLVNEDNFTLELMADQSNEDKTQLVTKNLEIPAELTGSDPLIIPITFKEATSTKKTHVGVYADHKTEKLTLGGGFDIVDSPEGRTQHFLAKARWFPTENDQLGIAYRLSNHPDSSTTHSITGMYSHYGDEAKWGGRAFGRLDCNNQRNTSSFNFSGVLAQNPTFSKEGPNAWITDNQVWDGGMYAENVISPAIRLEGYCLSQRSKKGFVGEVDAGINDNQGIVSGYGRLELGYTFAPTKETTVGITGFGRHDFSNSPDAESKNTVGTNLYMHRKNLELQAGLAHTMSATNPSTSVYTSANIAFNGPKHQRGK